MEIDVVEGGEVMMVRTQEVLYAAVGVGDLALQKAMNARKVADPRYTRELYSDLVDRGRSLSTRIRKSSPTRQAAAQTKVARSQVKAATTSVTKAVRANAQATRSAAKKTAKAS